MKYPKGHELKTLKDFERVRVGVKGVKYKIDAIGISEIRQEAIKRIKHYLKELRMRDFDLNINLKNGGVETMTLGKNKIENLMCGAVIELVNFFNITEEDLR